MQDTARPFERRWACTLSIDVVGYSLMIARDDAATVGVLRVCRDIITNNLGRRGGRMFTDAGDGFRIEFASPEAAVECGLAIQDQIRRHNADQKARRQIWLRTGVAAGEVIDENGDLHGESVNIAVRLQEACPAGGMLIAEEVEAAVCDSLDAPLKDIGALKFRNIPDRVRAYELEIPGADVFHGPASARYDIDLTAPISGFGRQTALAVLPLANESKDDDLDYVADGLSDSLITALSHMRQFPIIDRNSSFTFRDKESDARTVGATLGARYVIGGELHTYDDAVRISLRLTDCENASTVWGGAYTFHTREGFHELEDIARRAAATIEGRLEREEGVKARAIGMGRIDATALIWRGKWHLNKLTKADSETARDLFDLALEKDPTNSEALIQLGFWHWIYCWAQRRPREDIIEFRNAALEALHSNELDSRGHLLTGSAEILLTDLDSAMGHFREALRLNPSSALSLAQTGSCHMLLGELDDAVDRLRAAIRLNPQDYYLFTTYGELACSYCMMGKWKEALEYARRSLTLRPSYWHARMSEITALSELGRKRDAVRALEALLTRRADFFQRPYIDWLPFADRSWNEYFQQTLSQARAELALAKPDFDAARTPAI